MQLSHWQFDTGNLELLAKQAVEGFIIGLHKSPFHGFSVEFAEHRLYNQGDSLKHIDWKVYAKSDKMFVKKFEEETNLKCNIAVDISPSMAFGDEQISKIQFASLGAAAIMQLLRKQLDASGLTLFTDTVTWRSAIKSSERHYKSLITQLEILLANGLQGNSATNLPRVLHELAETLAPRSLLVVFSDFLDDAEREKSFFEALQHLRFMKIEVIIFHVGVGKQEWEFHFDNRPYEFQDLETGEKVKLKPSEVKDLYRKELESYFARLQHHCIQLGIDFVPCNTQTNINEILQSYLLRRNKLM